MNWRWPAYSAIGFVLFGAATGCSLFRVKSSSPFAKVAGWWCKCLVEEEQYGEIPDPTYYEMLKAAGNGDKTAISFIFGYRTQVDGAGTDQYAGNIVELMKHLGDAEFAACLDQEDEPTRCEIGEFIALDISEVECEPADSTPFREDYPLTYAVCLGEA